MTYLVESIGSSLIALTIGLAVARAARAAVRAGNEGKQQ